MQQKIALYEEVLTLEPGSRLFFPLAEMYLKKKMPEKAEVTLRRGLALHPDFLEAKLLLLDVLFCQGKMDEMSSVAAPLVDALQGCSALWAAWSSLVTGKEGDDKALLLRMMGHVLSGKRFSWTGVMSAGMDGISGCGQEPCLPAREEGEKSSDVIVPATDRFDRLHTDDDPDAEEVDLTELEDDVKTRTLADLLAYQEEYEQAMLIYEQLRDTATIATDRQLFQSRMDAMQVKLDGQEQAFLSESQQEQESSTPSVETASEQQSGNTRVVDTLSALADRLEQRGLGEDENRN